MTTEILSQAMIQNGKPNIDLLLESIDQLLFEVVDSDVSVLRDASRHILSAGGKRVRPRLLLLSYLATGGRNTDDVMPVAAAIELVHTASIVHDDINDHGVLRRGRPSVNAIWGRTFALLTGDYLFTKVYELMAPYKELNVTFAEATTALLEGETLQALAVKEKNFSSEIYFDIISRKTAALFKAAGILGGKLSKADSHQIEALGSYAYNVGMAFQIIDDILDIIGDEEQLGKTAGIDVTQGKGFASIQDGQHASKAVNDPTDDIKRKLLAGGRLDKAREQAKAFVQMAHADLSVLPESVHKDLLLQLADSVVKRQN